MEELVQIVANDTGITPDQARAAIQSVMQHLESKMSPSMAGILNTILVSEGNAAGGNPMVNEAEGMLKSVVGGFFK